jgi:nucleotide-binding universal stress UspA family protein
MKKQNSLILVPVDFTKVAESAINHATIIAKKFSSSVRLLHVVSSQSKIDEAKGKLESMAAENTAKSGISFSSVVRVGSIFEDIGDVAAEIGADMIIMGTHGVKGLQHITGSNAMKVITNSKVPFVVVQEKSATSGFEEIVLPLNFSKETKQKLAATAELAKSFNSKVFIITPKEDDEFLANAVNRNLSFAKNYLTEHKVPFVVKVADEKGSFVKQVIRYAQSVEADLIAIVNSNEPSVFPDFDEEQQVLTNEPQIPVLCINPVSTSVAGGVLGS